MPQKSHLEKAEFLRILAKRETEQISPEEQDFLDAYYNAFDMHEDVLENLTSDELEDLKQDIRSRIDLKAGSRPSGSRSYRWIYATTVAACIMLTVFAVFFFNQPIALEQPLVTKTTENDILPGSDKAVLTLADGSKVVLNSAKDEKKIYELIDDSLSTAARYHTVSTPRGGQFQLALPDGSRIWLNSSSSISFPSSFDGDVRKVEMRGEVYFEIAKAKKPFILSAPGQEVEVLGTHFNINAYPDEASIKTTLLEGSVKVRGADHRAHYLKPGQQSLFSLSGQFEGIEQADMEMAVAWKNGYFKFDRQDLQSVMRQVSRWYDVDVIYKGAMPVDEYVGKIKRSENISGVLKVLRLSKLNFTVQGRTIIVNN